nr:sister chromatid cohesion protein PDS5 homolog A isoform X1 [Ipomoea batatas]
MAQNLQKLEDLGSKLDSLPNTKDSLVKLLKQGSTCLSDLDQSPPKAVLEAMQSFQKAIVKPELLKHQDREVKLLVATCICEITRITAPEAPYNDDVLKDIFDLIVSTFTGLNDMNSPYFGRKVVILETVARYRSCVVMLDLECDDLVNEMFSIFFREAREEHPENVLKSMKTIMAVILEESEDIREDLLAIILSALGRNKKGVTMAGRRLAVDLIEQCTGKLEPGIKQFLLSSMSGESRPHDFQIDYHEVIYDIYCCAPQILSGVVPYLTGELLADQLDVRLKVVSLLGDLFAMPKYAITEAFQSLFLEFLKRLTDRTVEVRMSVLENVKGCLLCDPFRAEAPQIISALCERLLDYDENVRKQVVAVLCDVACRALSSIEVERIKLVADRLRDKSVLVKRYTMERLAEVYRNYCLNCSTDSQKSYEYDWIPGKILRCFYDKDFRSDAVEPVLCLSLFPNEFSVKDKVKNWVRVFSGFDKVEVKALEKMLEQKQRLQQEMRRYLSLRQMPQDGDPAELQKKVMLCFRIMSHCFTDTAKAEENFQILDQLKDANVWKILGVLLDPNTASLQACNSRDDLLKILGEKHPLYDFLSILSLKCSYILFSKEHVRDILLEVNLHKSAGSSHLILSCMTVLVILARFSPLLLSGLEENLIHLLEDDNEIIKEGVLHILAKAGGSIREQLGVSSRSLDLMLERFCVEGSRRQAKYAVHALASITTDDGLMSLSVLYKRLVDMLKEKSHLAAVLQSLGCIAQTAMPVFETREIEIEEFIKKSILECNQASTDDGKDSWGNRSEICLLKIFGIKTLVKSYLPVKDAHLRSGIDDLMLILKNILCFGEISKEIQSSSVDKAHLRLAAAKAVLRLSKHWEHKIPVDVFYLALRTPEANFPQVKKLLLNKVHQYIKDRLLDPKYACAFFLDMKPEQVNIEEVKNNLSDIIQMCQQGKARHLSSQSDANAPTGYPEYILPYLVHALAHHPLFPNIEECKDVKAFEPFYRQLHLFLSMFMHRDDDGKSQISKDQEKESIAAINSILHSVKQSQDAVDATKSKNLYGISDLGLSIIKRLASKQDDALELNTLVPLPTMLFKQREKDEGNDTSLVEQQTWLTDEKVLVQFETLMLETNGKVNAEITESDIMKDSETDGNEMPLGKIMKRLKAKGSKARNEVKNESSLAEVKNDVDDDILKMVREINSDSAVNPNKFESSNGHEYVGKGKTSTKHQKRKTDGSDTTDGPVPKKRRSSAQALKPSPASKNEKPNKKLKASVSNSTERDDDLNSASEDKSLEEDTVSEDKLLNSCIRKNSTPSAKRKRKVSDLDHEVDTKDYHKVKKSKENIATDGAHISSDSKSGSMKKQKRKNISGLAKCTSKGGESPTMDLIGCRIKVWWPMDKQFYEGVIKSFDTQKKKHVILYEDGDVEVLRLDKERWELVDRGEKPVKRSKSSKGASSKGVSGDKKGRSSGGSGQKKAMSYMSPSSQVRGKRTPRKNLKYGQKGISKSRSLFDDFESDKGKREEIMEKSSSDHEQSEKDDEISLSDGKRGDDDADAENESGDVGESKEECQSENKEEEEEPGTPHDAPVSDEQEMSSSDGKPQEEISEEKCSDEEHEVEKPDSPGSPMDDEAGSHPADEDESEETTTPADADFSDDETLSMWKRRVGKPAQRK